MAHFYQRPDKGRLFPSAEELKTIANSVPPLPENISSLEPPQIAEILECYYGSQLSKIDGLNISDLDYMQRIAIFRAFDVHEQTHLFREPFSLRALSQLIIPGLSERSPIKIASVGCSTGAEPLSILLTNWSAREKISLTGFDINPTCIDRAKSSSWFIDGLHYGPTDASPATVLQRTFETKAKTETAAWNDAFRFSQGEKYWITNVEQSTELMGRLNYELHDILLSPLSSQFDVILLQNVLCHYSPRGRDSIMSNIRDSLTAGGVFIGDSSYTLANAAKDPESFQQWYDSLEHFGFTRMQLPLHYSLSNETYDDTSSVFVYSKTS